MRSEYSLYLKYSLNLLEMGQRCVQSLPPSLALSEECVPALQHVRVALLERFGLRVLRRDQPILEAGERVDVIFEGVEGCDVVVVACYKHLA